MIPAARTDVGTVEDLHASATRLTGLADFGPAEYLPALKILLSAYATEAALTPAGSKATRQLLRSALVARLISTAAFAGATPIRAPIFVTGLPRTGTTALHRLLTADPAHQGLELWLTEVPQPRPPRDSWESNPLFVALQEVYRRHHVADPEFMGLHYMAADQVEECWRLLCQSFRSVSFECTAYLPSYSAWLATQDWTAAYRRHRRNLELIGSTAPDRRWVLKNPSHLFALDALLEVYPDAVIIQTHRDPRTSIASVCSLNARASAGWSTVFHGPVLGRAQLSLWSRGVRSFRAARARHDAARFIDVRYEDFVADPLRTVESIYSRLGEALSPPARAAMTAALHAAHRPAHAYDLSDFGLTPAQVDAAFAE